MRHLPATPSSLADLAPPDFLQALQTLLQQHGVQDKLGLALLHDHWEMSIDQCLIEKEALEDGKLVSEVGSFDRAKMQPTIWSIDTQTSDWRVEKACYHS